MRICAYTFGNATRYESHGSYMSYSFKSEGFPMPLLLFYISPMISRLLPLLPFLIAATALADEGMWLFNKSAPETI
jgi:hypothetical protein